MPPCSSHCLLIITYVIRCSAYSLKPQTRWQAPQGPGTVNGTPALYPLCILPRSFKTDGNLHKIQQSHPSTTLMPPIPTEIWPKSDNGKGEASNPHTHQSSNHPNLVSEIQVFTTRQAPYPIPCVSLDSARRSWLPSVCPYLLTAYLNYFPTCQHRSFAVTLSYSIYPRAPQ